MIKPYKAKYKVYYIEYDEDRNEIARGVDSKEYINYGNALNRARKLGYTDRNRYDYEVAWRDPWVEYSVNRKCEICGWGYRSPITHEGYGLDPRVHLCDFDENGRARNKHNYRHVCPVCYGKITKFIDKLKGGQK